MSTFIGQLIGFAVIVWLVVKFVLPPLRTMMDNQQEAVRKALEESASAADKLANADQLHAEKVAGAKAEAARVAQEARADSIRISEQLGEQAVFDADRIRHQGAQQVHLMRQQTIRELRSNLGAESVQRAEDLVRAHVADAVRQSETVDRFLSELEGMAAEGATSTAAAEIGAPLNLRAASRAGLAAVVAKFEQTSASMGIDDLGPLADDVAAVTKLLQREGALTKHLAQPSGDTHEGSPQVRLAQSLFQNKISAPAYDIVSTVVAQRWSADRDLLDALQHVSRMALLARADRLHDSADVEDELFRFSRVLDAQPQLSQLLSEFSVPVEQRVALLNTVLDRAGSVNAVTRSLLTQTVELLHGARADVSVDELAELAVVRRGELVAHIEAAAELTDSQRTRLADVLARIYGHPVSLQVQVDPELLGGLQITIGDEVIDGSIASRLAAARMGLPD